MYKTKQGFIENVKKHKENNKYLLVLTLRHRRNRKWTYRNILKRISRFGLQIYSNYQRIPRILSGMRIVTLSTFRGITTDGEAQQEEIRKKIKIVEYNEKLP
ncbi:hypothetical protein AMTRI_Chr13g123780 [Amborella trichopoda]